MIFNLIIIKCNAVINDIYSYKVIRSQQYLRSKLLKELSYKTKHSRM